MKKKITAILAALALVSVVAQGSSYNNIDIAADEGKQVTMIGTIVPSVISVTLPAVIPFDISKNVTGENKVISPVVTIKNNSTIPLFVSIRQTNIDMRSLGSTQWSDTGEVNDYDNKIAVGFKKVFYATDARPTTVSSSYWLRSGDNQIGLMELPRNSDGYAYVVGRIGNAVPENAGTTFSVVPTFVVTTTSAGLIFNDRQ